MSTTHARRRWLIAGTTAAALITSASVATTTIVLNSHPAAVTMRPTDATAPATPKLSTKSGRTASRPAPRPAKTAPAPTPTRTVYVTPPPAQAPAPASSTSAPAQPQLTNASAVVLQYYQDITDHDWQAAWALGGNNIAAQNGQTYDSWVSGYTTTAASISVTSYGTWDNGTVWTDLSATQLDGSMKTYSGTYTAENGVITSASITQTS